MSRKHRPGKNKSDPTSGSRRQSLWLWASLAVLAALIFGFVLPKKRNRPPEEKPVQITGPVTFSKDIAPIVFNNCAQCHRPNGSGPFELLTYNDVKKRAKD